MFGLFVKQGVEFVDEIKRINLRAASDDTKVQVRSRYAPAVSAQSDDLPFFHPLPDFNFEFWQMIILRKDFVAVVDDDRAASVVSVLCDAHYAVICG